MHEGHQCWLNEPRVCDECHDRVLKERDKALADLRLVEELARLAPELNPSNYDHDDVCRLNAAMCELYEVVREYKPIANDRSQPR